MVVVVLAELNVPRECVLLDPFDSVALKHNLEQSCCWAWNSNNNNNNKQSK